MQSELSTTMPEWIADVVASYPPHVESEIYPDIPTIAGLEILVFIVNLGRNGMPLDNPPERLRYDDYEWTPNGGWSLA